MLEEAGQSLGASPLLTFLLVMLPNVWPGVRLPFEGSQLVIAAALAVQVGLIVLLVLVIERAIGMARIVQR